MKKIILTLLCFISIGINQICNAQNPQAKIDSLLNVLKTAKEDTSKVITLIDLCDKLLKLADFELATQYANDALHLSEKLNYQKGISDGISAEGSIAYYQGDFDKAMKKFTSTLKIKEKIGDKKGMSRAYGNIGLIHMNKGNYAEAMENNLKSLKIRRELKDTKNVGPTILNIANIYLAQGDYPAALKNYYEALNAFKITGERSGMALAYMNIGRIYYEQKNSQEALKNVSEALNIADEIGNKKIVAACYNNLGEIYDELGNYDKALKHYSDCIEIAKDIGSKQEIAAAYGNIGTIYFNQKKYDAALKNYATSLKIAEEIGDRDATLNLYNNIGKNYLIQKKYAEAGKYLLKGYSTAKEMGSKSRVKECLEGLTELEEHLGHYKQSLDYHKLYLIYKDSVLDESSNLQITEMQTKYESDKKEKEIALLTKDKEIQNIEIKKQKQLKYSFIGGLGLVIVMMLFGYRVYRASQVLRLQTIRNKIAGDLHDDIGSTLNSISIYSEVARKKDEQQDEALEMIGDASRKIIDAMSDIVWTINPDNDSFAKIIFRMKSLAYNLFRAKKIEFTFHSDEILNEKKLSLEERRNFYLIFKEAINNLVKYSNATRAAITLSNESDYIKLRIQDDGVGFDTSDEVIGNGLKNMKRRADEMKAQFKIESSKGNGTQIELILKA